MIIDPADAYPVAPTRRRRLALLLAGAVAGAVTAALLPPGTWPAVLIVALLSAIAGLSSLWSP